MDENHLKCHLSNRIPPVGKHLRFGLVEFSSGICPFLLGMDKAQGGKIAGRAPPRPLGLLKEIGHGRIFVRSGPYGELFIFASICEDLLCQGCFRFTQVIVHGPPPILRSRKLVASILLVNIFHPHQDPIDSLGNLGL